jgi:uncharacterized protein YoxC
MNALRELVMQSDSKIDELIRAIELSAESNRILASATEKEIIAVKEEYKDLRVIVETQANNTSSSIKELTQSMHEMSKSLQGFALKAQHNATENKTETNQLKREITANKTDIDNVHGQLLLLHQENNERDLMVHEVKKDIEYLNKDLNDQFKELNRKIDSKGKWWSDNWSKVLTSLIMVGSIVWGLALTISSQGTTP